jgi:hypothetical protein
MDINNPVTGLTGVSGGNYLNNHSGGQNTFYIDGHGEFLKNSKISNRYRNVYW